MKLIEQLKQAWLDDPEGHLNEITRFANGYVADVPGPWDEPSDPLDELLKEAKKMGVEIQTR